MMLSVFCNFSTIFDMYLSGVRSVWRMIDYTSPVLCKAINSFSIQFMNVSTYRTYDLTSSRYQVSKLIRSPMEGILDDDVIIESTNLSVRCIGSKMCVNIVSV